MKKGYFWRQKDFCFNINRHPMTHREEYDGSTAEACGSQNQHEGSIP